MSARATSKSSAAARKSAAAGDLAARIETTAPNGARADGVSDAWGLYEVFVRARRGLAHTHVGSLRAPDPEMALHNARDVYTRRQEGVSLWIVASIAVSCASPEETDPYFDPAADSIYRHPSLDGGAGAHQGATVKADAGNWALYEVFVRARRGLAHSHVGSLRAPDPKTALRDARGVYTHRGDGACLWVVASSAVTASAPQDKDSFFSPAADKIYRHPTFYDVPEGVQM